MLVVPPSIEKYRDPLDDRLLTPAADQLNRSCGRRLSLLVMLDPRPSTSSISCSTDRRASYVPLAGGRVNVKGTSELMVMMPSYSPSRPTVPSTNMAGGVFRPMALPSAVAGFMNVDRASSGRLAFAVASSADFASAVSAVMYVAHGRWARMPVSLAASRL